eukprot:jgi/Astpho2/4782/Aster-x1237
MHRTAVALAAVALAGRPGWVQQEVAVVLALSLPFFALSFGHSVLPSTSEMDAAAQQLSDNIERLAPWELCVLIWAELAQAASVGRQPLNSQDAAMLLWGLAVLHELTPELWTSLLHVVAQTPLKQLDEVTLIHVYQAGMFADLIQIAEGASAAPGEKVSSARSALQQEVQQKLLQLPAAVLQKAQQAYLESASQPGFDGPFIVELTILRTLNKVHSQLNTPAYRHYFHDLRPADLERARQLTQDPYMLIKFKVGVATTAANYGASGLAQLHKDTALGLNAIKCLQNEIAEKQARQNDYKRQLTDISRTLTMLGVEHQLQVAVEDGLVGVDVALPDYKLALFLDGSHQSVSAAQSHLTTLDPDGSMLSGWAPEADKKAAMVKLLDSAGQMQLMKGRMHSMVHGRHAGPSDKSRFEHGSIGYHLHK